MEKWLNGWHRQGDTVWMGQPHCAGCGRLLAVVCVIIPEDYVFPDKPPDFPFPQEDCPLCQKEYRTLTVDDLVSLDISMLRKALAIKKSA